MSVRIRMKKIGRSHRPFYRICATDKRTPRGGRVLEELGTYDTTIVETDARAVLKSERVDYWLSVGAQPSEKVAILIKKYGTNGTHKSQQEAALERLAQPQVVPAAGAPASLSKKKEGAEPAEEKPAEAKAEAPSAEEKPVEEAAAAPEEETAAPSE